MADDDLGFSNALSCRAPGKPPLAPAFTSKEAEPQGGSVPGLCPPGDALLGNRADARPLSHPYSVSFYLVNAKSGPAGLGRDQISQAHPAGA